MESVFFKFESSSWSLSYILQRYVFINIDHITNINQCDLSIFLSCTGAIGISIKFGKCQRNYNSLIKKKKIGTKFPKIKIIIALNWKDIVCILICTYLHIGLLISK